MDRDSVVNIASVFSRLLIRATIGQPPLMQCQSLERFVVKINSIIGLTISSVLLCIFSSQPFLAARVLDYACSCQPEVSPKGEFRYESKHVRLPKTPAEEITIEQITDWIPQYFPGETFRPKHLVRIASCACFIFLMRFYRRPGSTGATATFIWRFRQTKKKIHLGSSWR